MNDPKATLLDVAFVQRCYDLAEAAARSGNNPYGALLMLDGEVVAEAQNGVVSCDDVTRHAELDLVRQAWRRVGPDRLPGATLYASTEPCVMCAGAIFWARIPRIVYGVGGGAAAAKAGRPYEGLPLRDLAAASDWSIEVVGPVMEEDGLRSLTTAC